MPLFALILLTLFALVILAGVILALIAGIRPVPRFDLRRLFPAPPPNDFFFLIRTLTMTDTLWHPGRGENDPVHPGEIAHEFGCRVNNTRVVFLPACGHLSHEERPDEFNKLMEEFLSAHTS